MNIWQWIIVIGPFIRFGSWCYKLNIDIQEKKKTKSELIGGFLGVLIVLFASLFVLYKAKVLVLL